MTGSLAPAERGLARDTASITGLNLASRITGFVRVLAMAAALGATPLGDAYQAANLVSNILFELLAGGLLAAVLVPVFVEQLGGDDPGAATRLARALLGRVTLALGAVVALVMVASEPIMRVLTLDADVDRAGQVELGRYLLWFFAPQLLLYAFGAVATALLQARRRFVAAAAAPIANNLVVIVTMVAFRWMRDGSTTLPLDGGERLLLGGGTTLGVAAMTVVPLLALGSRTGSLRPTLGSPPVELRPLLGSGLWAAGHLGLNQLLVAVTIVLAAGVEGGVVAYHVAFTFFLLPHAVLANPVFTALYPRLSEHRRDGRLDAFAHDLTRGLRLTALAVAPAAALLVALAGPILDLVRLGNLDAAGADLVSLAVVAYAPGLLGYSCFYLLTRASYAVGDARAPTLVNASVTVVAIVAMVAGSAFVDGDDRLLLLGLTHAAATSVGTVLLWTLVRRRAHRRLPWWASLVRGSVLAVLAGIAARLASDALPAGGRVDALAALAVGGLAGAVVYVSGHAVLGRDRELLGSLRR